MAARTGGTTGPVPAGTRPRPFAPAWRRAQLTVDERDCQAFASAVAAGRLTVQAGG
jgi:hypothetical protein